MSIKKSNKLIEESSPYLLQHAYNPVNWYAWNDETLSLALEQDKLIIISVGYAACHWCHVMEHESFEDEEVAQVMNDDFINIKVDREERPDIDHIYMNAVQLMTGAGGWPMNVVALPDGRPVWGGTYFKKDQWTNILKQIANLNKQNPDKLVDYASKLEIGIKNLDLIDINNEKTDFTTVFIKECIENWSKQFDYHFGGINRAPKFMMPNNYNFLLRYAHQTKDEKLMDYVNTTLSKMAMGGIFDHIGGGFSRYSVDEKWHVPHFEKMLYDNAQLVSLYADAYLATKNNLYKEAVIETLSFVKTELTGIEGNFYSSLDADSINDKGSLEEGAYYVWTRNELKNLLQKDYELFSDYYNVNKYGHWEHENFVLIRNEEDASFKKKHKLDEKQFKAKKELWKKTLYDHRQKRRKPGLDDKSLTSWNALMLKAYVDAFRAFGDRSYLDSAILNANFILNKQIRDDGGINHSYKNGESKINGFLEDYATTIDAFISVYELTLDKQWLVLSRDLTNYVFDHFFDDQSKLFYFTSDEDRKLISRSLEYRDNVIPASNSIMAKNLFKLSKYFDNEHYKDIATHMLQTVKPEMQQYPSGYSNWLDLMLNYTNPFFEVVVIGQDVKTRIVELNTSYIPNKLVVGSAKEEYLHLLENKFVEDKTLIYICINESCKLPVDNIDRAFDVIEEHHETL